MAFTKRMRLVERRRKLRATAFLVILALSVVAYAALGWGLTHKSVSITIIKVIGNSTVSAEQLQTTAWQGLAVTRGLLLYGGTIFTYDKANIVDDLLYIYPKLKSVEFSIIKLDTLELTVSEREPVAQWCTSLELGPLKSCYLVDSDGFVFEEVDEQQEALVVYTGDLAGNVLRQTLLHGDFAHVHTFVNQLRGIGIEPLTITLLEGEASISSAEHPILKVKLDENLERTLSYVEVTLNSKEYKTADNYMDFRFGNRVYYK